MIDDRVSFLDRFEVHPASTFGEMHAGPWRPMTAAGLCCVWLKHEDFTCFVRAVFARQLTFLAYREKVKKWVAGLSRLSFKARRKEFIRTAASSSWPLRSDIPTCFHSAWLASSPLGSSSWTAGVSYSFQRAVYT